ncbi:MAG: hypothetical protein IIZ21_00775, partial [Firmicutes bacterium]|nr:hypothetical protein [Bacillota bacterium]
DQPFTMEVVCSRGTYIRSICHDLGQLLGCGACMSSLVRTATCGYRIEEAVSLEALRGMTPQQIEALLDPLETAVSHLPRLDLTQEQAKLFLNGNPLWSEDLPLEDIIYAVYFDQLIGICKGNLITKVLK